MDIHKESLISTLNSALKVIRMFDWLLDLYVLDFFVDNHWGKLPESWQKNFINVDPSNLGDILTGAQTKHVYPLSFLAMLSCVKTYGLPRDSVHKTTIATQESCDTKINLATSNKLFLKHVKLKKRHEISVMAEVVRSTAVKSECDAVIDFGSGLGHLVRMLAYKYDLCAAGIECQVQLSEDARNLDHELEITLSKHLPEEAMTRLKRPIHLNITLSNHEQLLQLPLPDTMQSYGLIGLHPCGDLGPTLLKHFVNNPKVKFTCVVGCCYMKLTTDERNNFKAMKKGKERINKICIDKGYPMSEYMKEFNSNLSYVSREISCHAIEVYCDRLRSGKFDDLKVHAYRAALERILIDTDPELKHAPIRSIKHSDSMNFKNYCTLALERLNIPLPLSPSTWIQGEEDLSKWKRVVILYTLRLALAPLVESIVLLDRVLYVREHGLNCEIHPVFDPKLSPRNHIIIARR